MKRMISYYDCFINPPLSVASGITNHGWNAVALLHQSFTSSNNDTHQLYLRRLLYWRYVAFLRLCAHCITALWPALDETNGGQIMDGYTNSQRLRHPHLEWSATHRIAMPPSDVDFIWRAHMQRPADYQTAMREIKDAPSYQGQNFDHRKSKWVGNSLKYSLGLPHCDYYWTQHDSTLPNDTTTASVRHREQEEAREATRQIWNHVFASDLGPYDLRLIYTATSQPPIVGASLPFSAASSSAYSSSNMSNVRPLAWNIAPVSLPEPPTSDEMPSEDSIDVLGKLPEWIDNHSFDKEHLIMSRLRSYLRQHGVNPTHLMNDSFLNAQVVGYEAVTLVTRHWPG
jgi:hypothetical protein